MSLSNLIALQKQKQKLAESPAVSGSHPETCPTVEVESPQETCVEESAPQATPKPAGLGLNLARNAKQPGKPPSAIPPKPAPSKPASKPAAVTDSVDFSLEQLASMDASAIETEAQEEYGSGFDDEIEATAPDRALDPDLTAGQLAFVESLDGIYSILHDPEMFKQSVQFIMIELQENPEYEKLLSDSDVHTMIRGMRRTMGLAKVRKQENSRKAKTNTNARKKSGVSDSAMAALKAMMGESDDD